MYRLLGEILERNVRESSERAAVSDADRSFSYGSIGSLVGHLAGELERAGVAPGEPIGISGPRDARLMALLYGVVGCGNPVVVISPDWSESDRARRLRTVGARTILSTEAGVPDTDDCVVLTVDVPGAATGGSDRWGSLPGADDVVYFSFTSGSSGEPKAVAVAQRNAAHYAVSLANRLGFENADAPTFAHLTTLAADLGHTSWMIPLATGGRVHVVSEEVARDPFALWRELADHGVTCFKTTPSHLAALLPGRAAEIGALDTVVIGGELLRREFAAGLLDGGVARRVVNHYGPTEATVGVACFVADRTEDLPGDETAVPIGKPIGETTLVLNDAGDIGELVIGGAAVTLGYVGMKPGTESRFRLAGDNTVYHTGDRCRRRSDGNLVFLGRVDRQRKVNGYRVDLAEIEHVLADCAGVARAAIVDRTVQGQVRLVAAVVLDDHAAEETVAGLPELMGRKLPRYAIPAPILPLPGFPVDANGKRADRELRALIERRLSDISELDDQADETVPRIVRELAEFWGTSLGFSGLGPDADVVRLGGDSILAMRTVVFLKDRGHQIVVTDVYEHPTAAGLAGIASVRASSPEPVVTPVRSSRRGVLGPAQRWWFGAAPEAPSQWNQAVLLACEPALDIAALTAALGAVLDRHEALRSGISADGALDAEQPAAEMLAVTWSSVDDDQTIERTSAELNRSLDLESGRLMRCHVFRGDSGAPDRLLLVCHHLVVDTISWRIVLEDLLRSYEAAVEGDEPALAPARSYYDWAAAVSPIERRSSRRASSRHGTTYSWTATPEMTRRLVESFGQGLGLEALLIASITRAVQTTSGARSTRVNVETHGRDLDERTSAYFDTVGWFTAVKPVLVEGLGDDVGGNVAEVERLVAGTEAERLDLADDSAALAVNYLGRFRPPAGRFAKWKFAGEYCGPARSREHDPMYPMVLTARLVDDRLVADLVCTDEVLAAQRSRSAFERFVSELAHAAGTAGTGIEQLPGTTSGLPAFTGALGPAKAPAIVTEPPRVLLTGATGFLGSHILDHLSGQGARVVCVVRGNGRRRGWERLAPRDQVSVVEGDLADDSFARRMAETGALDGVNVVINAAADVRLVASPEALARVNVGGVRNLLEATAGRPEISLHHVSTLAVAGYHDVSTRRFSEADFDLGQKFLSPYEASKFEAERLVRQASDSGRRCSLYRTNHVAAHSLTGEFQANISDNRVYQTLKGYLLSGCAPSSPGAAFGFSHVDTVAAGICRIALATHVPPDVHHVETAHSVAHDELIGWLRECGYPVRLVERGEFIHALRRLARTDARSAEMSRAWEHRPDRNVRFDNTRTLSLLRRLGVEFAAPDQAWLGLAMKWAGDSGFIPAPATVHEMAG